MTSELAAIVSIIKDELQVSKESEVILFGSRSNDTAKEDSDYDFLLVVDDTLDAERMNMLSFNIRLRLLNNNKMIPIDLILKKRGQYKAESVCFGSLAYNIKQHGIAV